ncbi:MAG: TetR/AcrR family transcriptional regulator [Candidatus Sumerlaeia bacterium]|nr:TetR/AcrR family transcriptional regulator [Candidatus Sumerlaeia bacterium]
MNRNATQRRPRLERKDRREQIVAAALRAFSRHGFRGTTTRALAREAGITEVTLFRYFPSKEKLFAAVLERYSVLPVLEAELLKGMESRPGARAALRRIGRCVLAILRERRDLIRLMLSEAVTHPRTARMLFRHGPGRMIQTLARILETYMRQGEIRRTDPTLAARTFLGVFFSFILMQEIVFRNEFEAVELDHVAAQLGDMLWHGLQPAAKQAKGAGAA